MFCRGVFRKNLKKFKNCPQYIWKEIYDLYGCFIKIIKIFFLPRSLLKKNKNSPYTIYGKLGVKSFTFLYDLSNESQNITKKDMPPYVTYLSIFNYLIVVSCLNIKAG